MEINEQTVSDPQSRFTPGTAMKKTDRTNHPVRTVSLDAQSQFME
jgi:hypothetical protein